MYIGKDYNKTYFEGISTNLRLVEKTDKRKSFFSDSQLIPDCNPCARYRLSAWIFLGHGRHVADEAAGLGQDVCPGVPGGARVYPQVTGAV